MKKTPMNRILAPALALLALVLLAGPVQAQDSKIETGIVAYNSQDFKKAVEALKIGLSNTAEVKPKNLPRGYYYLGMASFQYMRQIVSEGGDMEAKAPELEALLNQSYDALINARKTDAENKWTDKVDKQLNILNISFLQGGMTALNSTYGKDVSESDKQEAYKKVAELMNKSVEIDPSNYMAYDLRAQAKLSMRDTVGAAGDFTTAVQKFEGKIPERPDQLIAYAYYRLALIERSKNKNLDAALTAIDKGKSLLEKEHMRLQAQKDKYKPEEMTKLEEQYEGVRTDLTNFELDILLNAPEKLQEALAKFEKAIQADPKNYILYVAYAQLLEKVDKPKAEETYIRATQVDPNKQLAWFNLGALYVNLGVEKYKEANKEEKNIEKAKALQKEGDDLYRKALPNLRKALELQPCDGETLQALLNISINLSAADEAMATEYAKYKQIQKDCGAK